MFRRARGAPAPCAKDSRGAGGSYRHAPGGGGRDKHGSEGTAKKGLAKKRLWAV
ncbi:hypothetical protein E2C01_050001 [Portunus trituberculatus]|uniref:Uncharacterized protein n=1 Tax=Portunus trituberculatus TaxID=210409 RepID=A0A5B7GAX3_PORTR|nr:hypothetical protein [Portunus trituberculatus]